jgi:hypothetical protein
MSRSACTTTRRRWSFAMRPETVENTVRLRLRACE